MNEEQVYLAEVDLPVKFYSPVMFKDGSVITEEIFKLEGETIEIKKIKYKDNPYSYGMRTSKGYLSFKTEWLKNIRPKPNKVLKKVPLDKGTIELGDWIKNEKGGLTLVTFIFEGYSTYHWVLELNKIYTEYSYSKDKGKTWLPMYKEVEVEE